MARTAPRKPDVEVEGRDVNDVPSAVSAADAEQAFDALMDFDADTKPPLEFAPATPVSDPGKKVLVFRDSPRAKEAHRMDAAPTNSKVVLTEVGAVFASPEGNNGRGITGRLADGDTAHTLPLGSRIVKLGPQRFRATIPQADVEPLEFTHERFNMLVAEMTHILHDRAPQA